MKNLLLTLAMALGVLIFVMLGTYFFRMFDMLARGVSPLIFLKIIVYLLPDILRYALPFSVMISTVLVFSRMSADNEIVALKSSGISLWQIVAPGMFFTALISLFCLYLNVYLSPEATFQSMILKERALATENVAAMIVPGEITKLSDKLSIRVGRFDGDVMYDVHCYILDDGKDGGGSVVLDDITAESGIFVTDPDTGVRNLVLNNFSGSQLPHLDSATGELQQQEMQNAFLAADVMKIPFGSANEKNLVLKRDLVRKQKTMDVNMLLGDMMAMDEAEKERRCSRWVELNYRVALSLSPFAFFLMSVPFGIRSRRNETSIGLLICVGLGIFFYVFMMVGATLDKQPNAFPQLIVWIPDILYEIGGLWAIAKIAKR